MGIAKEHTKIVKTVKNISQKLTQSEKKIESKKPVESLTIPTARLLFKKLIKNQFLKKTKIATPLLTT